MTDKERDDALTAENLLKARIDRAVELAGDGADIYGQMSQFNRLVKEGWQPKPDRAEALAWMIEGLFAEAADNPCTCTSDENSCPHCNAWERATKQTRACIVEAIDELRAEWEAERPAVVVPMSAKMWAESVLNLRGAINATCEREAARFILSLDGAKGGE